MGSYFTIFFSNLGDVPASGITVKDDFNEDLVTEILNISNQGQVLDGALEWTLPSGIKPGAISLLSGIAGYVLGRKASR